MPSLIPGYEYDIFISYRQKDNKHDGWVTEFVDHLKGELESTFKEEISVYFDINPHDGLLETHDVDESLKNKLKCLVFIPIISRTYCDPKSFTWDPEFVYSIFWHPVFLAAINQKNEALELIDEIINEGRMSEVFKELILFIKYVFMGRKTQALHALSDETKKYTWIDPFLENIRGEKRFKKLMERVKYEWENFEV